MSSIRYKMRNVPSVAHARKAFTLHRREAGQTVSLALGNIAGQAVLILSLPLLLRLYGPQDFGQYSLVISVMNVLLIAATLKLELVIPTTRHITTATRLTALLSLSTIAVAALAPLAGLAWLAWRGQATLAGMPRLHFLLPLGILSLLGGLFLILRAWLVRQHAFRGVALMQLSRPITMVAAALALSFLFPHWARTAGGLPLLLAGMAAGIVALAVGLMHVGKREMRIFRPWRWRAALRQWRGQKGYLSAVSLSQILHQANLQLPLLGIAWLYGPVQAGWMALAMRIVMFPVMIAGGSLGLVMSRRLSGLHHGGKSMKATLHTMIMFLLLLGIAGYASLVFLAPLVVVPLFGEKWNGAISTIQAASIMGLGYFINSFTVFVPILLRRGRFLLLWNVERLVVFLAILGLGHVAHLDYFMTVILLGVASLLFHAAFSLLSLRAAGHAPLAAADGQWRVEA